MPYRTVYVKPEVFLVHRGTKVYNVYKDDDCMNNMPRVFWFTLDDHGDESSAFDVRDLKAWKSPEYPPFLCGDRDTPKNRAAWEEFCLNRVEDKAIRKTIRAALDSGELKPPVE
jgi:hypothetical protein